MAGLMFMQYKCLSCSARLKKSERQNHEKQFDHDVARKGVIVHPEETESEASGRRVMDRVRASKVYTEEPYPNIRSLFDMLNESILKCQRELWKR